MIAIRPFKYTYSLIREYFDTRNAAMVPAEDGNSPDVDVGRKRFGPAHRDPLVHRIGEDQSATIDHVGEQRWVRPFETLALRRD